MFIHQLDEGIHTWEDIARKFTNTYVYALGEDKKPQTYHIRAVIRGVVDVAPIYSKNEVRYKSVNTDNFDVLKLRPDAGIYNLQYRPALVSHNFTRQWRVGACDDNISISYMDTAQESLFNALPLIYEPKYYSFAEALKLIESDEKRHVAITSKYSLRKGRNRLVLLFMFKPILTFINGFSFFSANTEKTIKLCNNDITMWVQEYENYWRIKKA